MAQFRAEIQGDRGMASRQGNRYSGIWSHTRGWNVGVEVSGLTNEYGEDEFTVWITSGSNGHKSRKFVGVFSESDLES